MPRHPTRSRDARAPGANASRAALADAADAPLVAHATWVPARTPGMQVRADAGLVRADGELAMAMELSALADAGPAPAAPSIVHVRTPEALADFASVTADDWTPPDPAVRRFYAHGAPALLAPACPQRLYVGYVEGALVAAVEATIAGPMAELFGVSTRSAWRRRGFGTAMTVHGLRATRADGVHTAVLQASADGAGVYARIGFMPFGEVTEYEPTWTVGGPP
jgi:ribosomal protein S18 acetylase RimI-like enzyme